MKRKLLLGIALVAVGASLLSTGAFVDTPDEMANIEMAPSEGPNSVYAANDSGEITLDLSEDNQKLHDDAKGVSENSVTEIRNIFTVTYTDDGDGLSDRHVWFETDHDDVEFIRGTDSTKSIQGSDSSYKLAPGETIHIGIIVDTRGEHSVEEVDEFTIHVEELETASATGTDTSTATDDDETLALDSPSFRVFGLEPRNATVDQGDPIDVSATIANDGGFEGTTDVELRLDGETRATEEVTVEGTEFVDLEFEDIDTADLDGTYTHSVWTEDDSVSGTLTVVDDEAEEDDETDRGAGDGTDDESEGEQIEEAEEDEQDEETEDDEQEESEDDEQEESEDDEQAETDDDETDEETLGETDDSGAGGETIEAPGTTPSFTDPQQTLGSTVASTLLQLLGACLLGGGLFAVGRYGLQSARSS